LAAGKNRSAETKIESGRNNCKEDFCFETPKSYIGRTDWVTETIYGEEGKKNNDGRFQQQQAAM
tara:strand:- start:1484 stop:1675 length:192 start_codon:yes stop_codon:yes gene_type:complete